MAIVKMEKGDLVDFKRYLYVLKRGRLVFVLAETSHNQFVFICFTQTDYAIGKKSEESPMLSGRFNSVQEAINELADSENIFQFENWEEYFKWLISALRAEI